MINVGLVKIVVATLLAALFTSSTVLAAWAAISLEELIADTDLVVIGTLHSATEDSSGIGRGYVLVEQIVSNGQSQVPNTMGGKVLSPGNNLKMTWSDNWACAVGMHKRREDVKGIWLFNVDNHGQVAAAYPGRFLPLDKLAEVERLWRQVVPTVVTLDADIGGISPKIQSTSESIAVDVTPFQEFYFGRALIVLGLSGILYWVLYRSRFRFR